MKQLSVPKKEELPNIQQLINEYGDSLLRMCFLYLHDIHMAEDAVQDTYINVYQNWNKFKGECSEKTWITRIAINICKSYLRSRWYKGWILNNNLQQQSYQEDKISDDTVLKEISKLKPKYREVILLFYYQEMKAKDIANILHINESTVTVRLSRAREQLKKSLKGWYFNE